MSLTNEELIKKFKGESSYMLVNKAIDVARGWIATGAIDINVLNPAKKILRDLEKGRSTVLIASVERERREMNGSSNEEEAYPSDE